MSHNEKEKKVSIVILAKDEEKTIESVICEVKKSIEQNPQLVDEIIVIDGNSKDRTREIAQNNGALVFTDNGKGKGAGYKLGLEKAKSDVVVFMDADGSHNPLDIPRLALPILKNELDLVIGSRWKGGSDDVHPNLTHLVRDLGGNILSIIISYWFKKEITDCLNGFRAISKEKGLSLNLKADDFDIEHEMVIKALKKGLRVGEVPTHEFERKAGRSKLPTFAKAHKFLYRLIRELLF